MLCDTSFFCYPLFGFYSIYSIYKWNTFCTYPINLPYELTRVKCYFTHLFVIVTVISTEGSAHRRHRMVYDVSIGIKTCVP